MTTRALLVMFATLAGCSVPSVTFTPETTDGGLAQELGPPVNVARVGEGTIVSSPAGIECGATCSHRFVDGASVTLTATPGPGQAFAGWSNGCAGTGACTISPVGSAEISVVATFAPAVTLTVTLAGDASGTVVSDPAGISCGSTCSATFASGTMVRLFPMPSGSPAFFAGWSIAACAGPAPCTLVLSSATTTLSAIFARHGSATFASSGQFTVPPGVSSVRVVAVGGGGGGANGHQGGGGSGRVASGTLAVIPSTIIPVTVGAGGRGAKQVDTNDITDNTAGGDSSFGAMLVAPGGLTPTVVNGPGADGGSGGGGSCNNGVLGGPGGTNGAAGGACTYLGGKGQGSYAMLLAGLGQHVIAAASGGAGGTSSNAGGGGGGGVVLDGAGPSGGNGGAAFSGKGGVGYGAGGGAGGYEVTLGQARTAGGSGASGLVYVEW